MNIWSKSICKSKLLLLFAIQLLFLNVYAYAANIELRPDLVGHLSQLERIYPAQAPSAVLGALPEFIHKSEKKVVTLPKNGSATVIHLKGIIEKGDADRLDALLKDWSAFHAGIVLESPGGNFVEGLKLGKVIREAMSGNETNLGGVFVLQGTQCMSACALAFAGAVDPYHDAVDTRFIEEGAQIGFHMGILPKNAADRQVRAGDVLSLAYDIVAEYTALITSNRNPPALLQKSLKHRTAESFYIVKADINGWAVGFSPVSRAFAAKQIVRSVYDLGLVDKLCDTILAYGKTFKTAADMEFGRFAPGHVKGSGELVSGISETLPLNISRESEIFSCHFNLNESGRPSAIVWRGKSECTNTGSDNNEFPHGWCKAKPVPAWGLSNGILADALGCPGGKLLSASEGYYVGTTRTGTLKRDVNMRESASLKAGVVSQLKAGSSVTITECKIVNDSQGVWFAVKSDAGQGWTSARFIDEQRNMPHAPLEAQ